MGRSRTDQVLYGVIGVLMVALIVTIGDSLRNQVTDEGELAPEFSIRTDAGFTVSRSNFGGRLLVLNFWATWCPPCIEEIPSLNVFYEQLKDEGVVVLGISVDEDEATYRSFLDGHGISFLTARDPEAVISGSYGTYRFPETYIIDSNGRVLQKIIGETTWNDERMISYIQSLL